jgi:hypothetical protein
MPTVNYGRKIFSFDDNGTALKGTVVTEKALPKETEADLTRRLLEKYRGQQGTIEIVLKRGRPDYAVISSAGGLGMVFDV